MKALPRCVLLAAIGAVVLCLGAFCRLIFEEVFACRLELADARTTLADVQWRLRIVQISAQRAVITADGIARMQLIIADGASTKQMNDSIRMMTIQTEVRQVGYDVSAIHNLLDPKSK